MFVHVHTHTPKNVWKKGHKMFTEHCPLCIPRCTCDVHVTNHTNTFYTRGDGSTVRLLFSQFTHSQDVTINALNPVKIYILTQMCVNCGKKLQASLQNKSTLAERALDKNTRQLKLNIQL